MFGADILISIRGMVSDIESLREILTRCSRKCVLLSPSPCQPPVTLSASPSPFAAFPTRGRGRHDSVGVRMVPANILASMLEKRSDISPAAACRVVDFMSKLLDDASTSLIHGEMERVRTSLEGGMLKSHSHWAQLSLPLHVAIMTGIDFW